MKKYRVLFLCIIISLVVIVLYQTPYAPRTIISNNGRYFSLPFFETYIQFDPPVDKMVNFMKREYGIEFYQYKGEMYLSNDYIKRYYHEFEGVFEKDYNGICVATENYPEHYFYVRDNYGYIIDDYAPHLVYEEAQNMLHDMLVGTISTEFKVACIPLSLQTMEFGNNITVDSYLKYGEYNLVIVIHSDGENKYSEIENACDILYEYYYGYTTIDKYYDNPPNIIDFDNKPNKIISFNYISNEDYYNYKDDIYSHPEYEFDFQMEGYIYKKTNSYDLIPTPTTDLNNINQFRKVTDK